MNKTTLLTLWLLGVPLFSANSLAADVCRLNKWEKVVIEVPVEVKFENPYYRTPWAYSSLEPKLSYLNIGPIASHERESKSDRMEFVFCVYNRIKAGEWWKLTIGNRDYSIQTRRTATQPTSFVDSAGKRQSTEYGQMPLIELRLEDPDWIILKEAKWIETSNGEPQLEIELHNPLKQEYDGTELLLTFEGRKRFSCATPGKPAPVPVEVTVHQKDISVSSGDPVYDELIKREAAFHPEGCHTPPKVVMELGKTGTISRKESVRIRYALQVSYSHPVTKIPRDFTNWRKILELKDNRISPPRKHIE